MPDRAQKLFNRQYVLLQLVNLLVSVSFSMIYAIISSYASSLRMSVALAGSVAGAFSLSSMCARPFTGWLNDRYDRRRILILSTGGMGLCTLLYGLCGNYGTLLAVRIVHGVLFSFSSTVNMALLPSLVPNSRLSEGVSYFGVVTSLGMAAGPSIGLWLIGIGGYGLNFTLAGVIAVAGAALAMLLRAPSDVAAPVRHGGLHLRLSDLIAKECLIFALVDVAIASANGLESSMIALYAAQLGLGNIGWYFTLSAVTLCAIRLLCGTVADRRGVGFALYPGLGLMVLGFLMLWKADAAWMFAVASVVKTAGVGLARPAIQSAVLKAVPPQRRGSASSTYYIGSDIGQGTAPAIGGYIVDKTGGTSYGLAFALYTLPLMAGAVLYRLSARHEKRRAAQ